MAYSAVYAIDVLQSSILTSPAFWTLSKNGNPVPGYVNIPSTTGVALHTVAAIGGQELDTHFEMQPVQLLNVVLEEGDGLSVVITAVPGSLAIVVANFTGWIYPQDVNQDGVRGTMVDPQ